jgi:hypothetical protein
MLSKIFYISIKIFNINLTQDIRGIFDGWRLAGATRLRREKYIVHNQLHKVPPKKVAPFYWTQALPL